MLRKVVAVAVAAAALLVPAAAAGPQHVTLTLDWTPNPDHVGLYYARDEGLFAKAGLDVSIHAPSDPTAPLKLVGAGKTDFGVSYEQEVFFAAAKNRTVAARLGDRHHAARIGARLLFLPPHFRAALLPSEH